MQTRLPQEGFSLVELIVVIVLLGLLASGAGLLIRNPIDAYDAQLRRQLLVDQGEMALRQIAREVRRALPNSIRITPVGAGAALEMVNTVDGARYRDEFGGTYLVDPNYVLDFMGTDTSFNLLGTLNNPAAFAAGGGRRSVRSPPFDVSDRRSQAPRATSVAVHRSIFTGR